MRIERSGEGLSVLPVDADQIQTHFSALGMSESEVTAVEPYVLAATREIEDFAGLALISQTITLRNVAFAVKPVDDWWSGARQGIPSTIARDSVKPLYLPVRPAVSLASITIADDDTVIDLSDWRIYGADDPVLQPRATLPDGALDVVYAAGYGAGPAQVPADLRLAVLDHAVRLYERRGDETGIPVTLSATAARIVGRYRRVHL